MTAVFMVASAALLAIFFRIRKPAKHGLSSGIYVGIVLGFGAFGLFLAALAVAIIAP